MARAWLGAAAGALISVRLGWLPLAAPFPAAGPTRAPHRAVRECLCCLLPTSVVTEAGFAADSFTTRRNRPPQGHRMFPSSLCWLLPVSIATETTLRPIHSTYVGRSHHMPGNTQSPLGRPASRSSTATSSHLLRWLMHQFQASATLHDPVTRLAT